MTDMERLDAIEMAVANLIANLSALVAQLVHSGALNEATAKNLFVNAIPDRDLAAKLSRYVAAKAMAQRPRSKRPRASKSPARKPR